ncbi:hypothetical protein PHO31112_04454 [Pandoraea horticolens]|uniref:Uncharacterized protein n=1 Tax=Pandoraea horticolens TaxID=2508298 RepID=A0A5E4YDT5_9BURK|nr:hypothetical protein PHO31112_04454 [Pandoraea horticolens]
MLCIVFQEDIELLTRIREVARVGSQNLLDLLFDNFQIRRPQIALPIKIERLPPILFQLDNHAVDFFGYFREFITICNRIIDIFSARVDV